MRQVEVNQPIPYELFKAVAELLAHVYRLDGGGRWMTAAPVNNPLLSFGLRVGGGDISWCPVRSSCCWPFWWCRCHRPSSMC